MELIARRHREEIQYCITYLTIQTSLCGFTQKINFSSDCAQARFKQKHRNNAKYQCSMISSQSYRSWLLDHISCVEVEKLTTKIIHRATYNISWSITTPTSNYWKVSTVGSPYLKPSIISRVTLAMLNSFHWSLHSKSYRNPYYVSWTCAISILVVHNIPF